MEQIAQVEHILMVSIYLGYSWSACRFCEKYLQTTKRKRALFFVMTACVWSLSNLVAAHMFLPYHRLLGDVFFAGLVLLLYEAAAEKKIFAASVFLLASKTVENICGALLSCTMLFWMHNLKDVSQPVIDDTKGDLVSYAALLSVILVIRWMERHFEGIFYDKINRWYLAAAMPLLVMTAVMDAAEWGASYGILFRSSGNMGIYYDQIFSHIGMCLLAVLNLAAAVFYIYGMDRGYLELRKDGQYRSKIAAYKMLAEQYSRSERLRHDMKNHVIALSILHEKKEWEKLGSYLKNMQEFGAVGRSEDITGNRAVDALLYQKRNAAESRRVRWECDVTIPKDSAMDEFDFCIIFGNILDNALAACEKLGDNDKRFIHIQAKAVKKCFLIEVKNSAEEENIVVKKCSEKPHVKNRLDGHGIGLLNVSEIVQRYDGVMHISRENSADVAGGEFVSGDKCKSAGHMQPERPACSRSDSGGVFVVSIMIPLKDLY